MLYSTIVGVQLLETRATERVEKFSYIFVDFCRHLVLDAYTLALPYDLFICRNHQLLFSPLFCSSMRKIHFWIHSISHSSMNICSACVLCVIVCCPVVREFTIELKQHHYSRMTFVFMMAACHCHVIGGNTISNDTRIANTVSDRSKHYKPNFWYIFFFIFNSQRDERQFLFCIIYTLFAN